MTITKRQKEKARQERQREKALRRQQRRDSSDERTPVAPGEDPDIAGIVPGPQPVREDW